MRASATRRSTASDSASPRAGEHRRGAGYRWRRAVVRAPRSFAPGHRDGKVVRVLGILLAHLHYARTGGNLFAAANGPYLRQFFLNTLTSPVIACCREHRNQHGAVPCEKTATGKGVHG